MIDTSTWKEFRLGDLFSVKKGKRLTKEDQTNGETPYVGAIDSNNGIANYIGQPPIHKGNTISLSYNGSVGEAFYQPDDYWATDDVNALYSKAKPRLNAKIALFLCTILRKEKYRYSYGRKWVLESMEETRLRLPTTKSGKPDWRAMEDYMAGIENAVRESKETLGDSLRTKNKKSDVCLNVRNWKEYSMGDLFSDIHKAEAHVKGEMVSTDSKSQVSVPFVSRTEKDNACDGFVVNNGITGLEKGNAIIVGDTTSTLFYQHDDFVAGDHIVVCRSKCVNPYTALFFKSVFDQDRYRYCYGRAIKMELLTTVSVRLPATSGGEPDWGAMEAYIKSLPYGDRI